MQMISNFSANKTTRNSLAFGQEQSASAQGGEARQRASRLSLALPLLASLLGVGAGELAGPLLSDQFTPRVDASSVNPGLAEIEATLGTADRNVAAADFRPVIREMAPASVVIQFRDRQPTSGFLFRSADGQMRILTHYESLPSAAELNTKHDFNHQRISNSELENRRYQITLTPAPNAKPVTLEAKVAKTAKGSYAASYDSGLAVLEFAQPVPETIQAIQPFRFSDQKPGLATPVVALGNDDGKFRATQGIISHTDRRFPEEFLWTAFNPNEQGEKPMPVPGARRNYLATDTPVGTTGSALMNRNGELVGIIFASKDLFLVVSDYFKHAYTGGIDGLDGLHVAIDIPSIRSTLTEWGLAPSP